MGEILTGLISGIVSGTGMGGGTILILILSVFMGIEQHIAQATNLVFFIPTSLIAILINRKNNNIDWKIAITISITGIIGAILGAKISFMLNASTLKKYFGGFLALIAIGQIYSLWKEYRMQRKKKY